MARTQTAAADAEDDGKKTRTQSQKGGKPKEATPGRQGISYKEWSDMKSKKGWGRGNDGNFYKWEDLSEAERNDNSNFSSRKQTGKNKEDITDLNKTVEKLKRHDKKWRKIVTYGGGTAALAGLAGLVNSMRKENKK